MSIKNNQILNVFDLDGTLFDDRWRLDRIKVAGTLSDYDDYHSGIGYDQFYPHIASAVESASLRGEAVEYWTARPEKYRQVTFERLDNVFPFDEFTIKMRDYGDKRPSTIMKSAWLSHALRHGDYRIINVLIPLLKIKSLLHLIFARQVKWCNN